jgi:effector-binding domain-containing protein
MPEGTKEEDVTWEAGFIISVQAVPRPPLEKKVWEHRKVAAAMCVGPYEKLGEAVEKICAWIVEQGYEVAGPVLERYLDMNPQAVKPEALRTEIWVACRKK